MVPVAAMVETPIAPSVEPPIDVSGPAFELSPPPDVHAEPPPVEETEMVFEAAPIGTPLFSEEAVLAAAPVAVEPEPVSQSEPEPGAGTVRRRRCRRGGGTRG